MNTVGERTLEESDGGSKERILNDFRVEIKKKVLARGDKKSSVALKLHAIGISTFLLTL